MTLFSFKKLSIKNKLIVTIMGISTFILLSSLSLFMSFELMNLKKHTQQDLSTLASLIAKNNIGALMFFDAKAASENIMLLKAKPYISKACLYNSDGRLFADYKRDSSVTSISSILPEKIDLLTEEQAEIIYYNNDQLHIIKRIIFAQDKTTLGFVLIQSDRTLYWQRVSEYIYIIAIMLVCALFMALLLAYQAQKIFTGPIIELLASMHRVSVDKKYCLEHIKNDNDDELGQLVSGYNTMLEKLQQQHQVAENYQHTLEQRVKERTQQLKISHDKALEASRIKSIFLSNMSHEMRSLIHAILGYAQLLQKNLQDKDQLHKLQIIDKSGNHLLSLITEILDLAKMESSVLKINNSDFDLIDLVESIEHIFLLRCNEKGLNWTLHCFSDKPVLVIGDQLKLRQILINLLANACKFTDNGEILFKIVQLDDNYYQFIIKDTGIGMEKEALSRIFNAFHQEIEGELKGGTGLGLNISRKYADLLGADLRVKSELNKGSEFSISIQLLPVGKGDSKNTVIENTQEDIHNSKKTELKLEASFIKQLRQAAEYGQLSELKKLVKQLTSYGSKEKVIAEHLEKLVNNADLDGILNYVEKITNV